MKLRKDPECPLCGEHPTITQLVDYEAFCGLAPAAAGGQDMGREVSARELAERIARHDDLLLIDVREPSEAAIASIPGALLIPLNSLPERVRELDSSREIVLHCHHGVRSMRALEFLQQTGFGKLSSLRGGIDSWSRDVDPSVPRY